MSYEDDYSEESENCRDCNKGEINVNLEKLESENMLSLKIDLKTETISQVILDAVKNKISNLILKSVHNTIEQEFKNVVSGGYFSREEKATLSETVKEIIRNTISKKVDERFPEIVENKTNEFKDYIVNLKIQDIDRDRKISSSTIAEMAKQRVKEYIEKEMMESVKMTKQEIDDFAKQYFTQNLFKAMGVFGKALDQIEDKKA